MIIVLFLTQFLYANPPIDGGRKATLSEFLEVGSFTVKLESMRTGTCSITKVNSYQTLTSAHCLLHYEDAEFKEQYQVGRVITDATLVALMGAVTKIHIHPKYKEAVIKYEEALKSGNNDEIQKWNKLRALYDIGFLEFKKPEINTTVYPKIISKNTQIKERKKIKFWGYGDTRIVYKKDYTGNYAWTGESKNQELHIGQNEWVNCPRDISPKIINQTEELSNSLYELLEIKSIRRHIITDEEETIIGDGTQVVLKGDSGSMAFEEDINGNLVITGAASYISVIDKEKPLHTKYRIYQDNNLIVEQEVESLQKQWFAFADKSVDIKVINEDLKKRGLLNNDGSLKEGIKLEREYSKITRAYFSDLSHPDNAAFIKSVFPDFDKD